MFKFSAMRQAGLSEGKTSPFCSLVDSWEFDDHTTKSFLTGIAHRLANMDPHAITDLVTWGNDRSRGNEFVLSVLSMNFIATILPAEAMTQRLEPVLFFRTLFDSIPQLLGDHAQVNVFLEEYLTQNKDTYTCLSSVPAVLSGSAFGEPYLVRVKALIADLETTHQDAQVKDRDRTGAVLSVQNEAVRQSEILEVRGLWNDVLGKLSLLTPEAQSRSLALTCQAYHRGELDAHNPLQSLKMDELSVLKEALEFGHPREVTGYKNFGLFKSDGRTDSIRIPVVHVSGAVVLLRKLDEKEHDAGRYELAIQHQVDALFGVRKMTMACPVRMEQRAVMPDILDLNPRGEAPNRVRPVSTKLNPEKEAKARQVEQQGIRAQLQDRLGQIGFTFTWDQSMANPSFTVSFTEKHEALLHIRDVQESLNSLHSLFHKLDPDVHPRSRGLQGWLNEHLKVGGQVFEFFQTKMQEHAVQAERARKIAEIRQRFDSRLTQMSRESDERSFTLASDENFQKWVQFHQEWGISSSLALYQNAIAEFGPKIFDRMVTLVVRDLILPQLEAGGVCAGVKSCEYAEAQLDVKLDLSAFESLGVVLQNKINPGWRLGALERGPDQEHLDFFAQRGWSVPFESRWPQRAVAGFAGLAVIVGVWVVAWVALAPASSSGAQDSSGRSSGPDAPPRVDRTPPKTPMVNDDPASACDAFLPSEACSLYPELIAASSMDVDFTQVDLHGTPRSYVLYDGPRASVEVVRATTDMFSTPIASTLMEGGHIRAFRVSDTNGLAQLEYVSIPGGSALFRTYHHLTGGLAFEGRHPGVEGAPTLADISTMATSTSGRYFDLSGQEVFSGRAEVSLIPRQVSNGRVYTVNVSPPRNSDVSPFSYEFGNSIE